MSRKLMVLNITALGLSLVMPLAVAAQDHSHMTGGDAKLGSVHFATSCAKNVQPQFDRGVALLHSFEFGPAIETFDAVRAADPACAIADWGVALSSWGNPFAPGVKPAVALQRGHAAIERANAAKPKTQRERDYIAAAARLYDDFEHSSQQSRMYAYSDAMYRVAKTYPGDTEASIFYALSLAMSADLSDKTYARQLQAGAILEKLFAKQPQHPGLAHYIIHSYDFPPLAPRALKAARAYAKIAPDAPHALHMPAHIFTRVGSWNESIEANIASAAAARREGNVNEEMHASDYLAYAYLQSGRDAEAAKILDSVPEMFSRVAVDKQQIGAAPPAAAFFAAAAIPARYALERGDWAAAARLEARSTSFPFADAITWFARGYGAARSSDVAKAREAAKALDAIRLKLAQANEPYWSLQVEIQEISVLAWTSLAEKDTDYALTRMRAAVGKEDATEKSAITPGPLAPARELLGEMLLQLNRPAEAMREFETTLGKEPNRFRALYGATQAAKLSGNEPAAQRYAAALLAVCERADKPGRAELAQARAIAPERTGK
jgi:hypothetical protein